MGACTAFIVVNQRYCTLRFRKRQIPNAAPVPEQLIFALWTIYIACMCGLESKYISGHVHHRVHVSLQALYERCSFDACRRTRPSVGEDGLGASSDLRCVFPAFSGTIDTKRSGCIAAQSRHGSECSEHLDRLVFVK